jgi:hypothetical protein
VARYAGSSPKWLQATTVFLAFVVGKWFDFRRKKELLYNHPYRPPETQPLPSNSP